MSGDLKFSERGDKAEIELGSAFAPLFNDDGLIVCITTDADSAEILMVAWMNAEALAETLETGIACYWSRSRKTLWRKGETSGSSQTVLEIRTDCDQDALLLRVKVAGSGASCHQGYRSCFYRQVNVGEDNQVSLKFTDQRLADPDKLYPNK